MELGGARGDETWRFQETVDSVGQRGLAASAFAGKAQNLAAAQRQRHVFDGMDGSLAQVVDAEILDRQDRGCLLVRDQRTSSSFLSSLWDSCHFLRAECVWSRSLGLMISSIEKLIRVSAAPKTAINRPGGMNHHHAFRRRASPFSA